MSVVSSTEFNQRPSEIKSMSEREPVFVTERGRTTTVVLSVAQYERLRHPRPAATLYDLLAAEADDVELDIARDRSVGSVPDLED